MTGITASCPLYKLRPGLQVQAGSEGFVTILDVTRSRDGITLTVNAGTEAEPLPVTAGPADRIQSIIYRRPWDAPAAA